MKMMKALALAALLSASATVAAQPAPAPAPGGGQTDDQKKAEAKTLYDKGLTHYNLGEFDLAIADFRAAYAISSAPGLLFNIAQSFRLKKDYEQASYFYATYLRLKPDAANRADVEARIAEMNTLIEQQKKLQNGPPTGTVTPEGDKVPTTTTTTPTTPTASTVVTGTEERHDTGPPASGKPMIKAGIVTASIGGALILTGIVFGRLASSKESDLNDLNQGGTWTQEAQDNYDAGKRDNKIAIVSLVVGGAALATGGVLWFLGNKKESAANVAIVPTKTGTTAVVGWSF